MSVLVSPEHIFARRAIVRGPLEPLAASLAADLEPLLNREIHFPAHKAMLSREGGRCARDGTLLEFDPFRPHEHRCARCGEVHRGEAHDRYWIYWYQLWLAERAVHAATLSSLGVDGRFAALAEGILEGYVDRYISYPNVDNVLGPARLFFSTYLESIWLLQICIAVDLLGGNRSPLGARVRDRIIEPARSIIAEYDEGGSNRQVWNDAALLAAALLLDDARCAEDAVYGRSGVATQLSNGLLSDGTWFEGENYHLFAHRGLWYGVTMAERAGLALSDALTDRFQCGFSIPFATALPDLTLPSRRDSQYAISLRQWRVAEHLELGLARANDPAIVGALERLYRDVIPRRHTGRSTSAADVERNAQPSALSRTDLGWRALLCARPALPSLDPVEPRSRLLRAQGIAVFRRDGGESYVALDYGESGGGHGHPDRLNILLVDGETRWLDDYGTGSYVDPSLHWYRSTLAHNAPLVNGQSQRRVSGALRAYDERGAAGWIVATAEEIGRGVSLKRTMVVLSGYCIDEVDWRAEDDISIDLPFHADVDLDRGTGTLEVAELLGGQGTEDGFRFAFDAARQRASAGACVHGRAAHGAQSLQLWARCNRDAEWWRAVGPGPPGGGDRGFRFVRARAPTGRHQAVFSWRDAVSAVDFGDDIRVTMRDGSTHAHRRTETGWHIDLTAGGARSSIDLGGYVSDGRQIGSELLQRCDEPATLALASGRMLVVELAEPHYRRSERAWANAGRPTALVAMQVQARLLDLGIAVMGSDLTFAAAEAANPYDNEHADVNGDGVQLYIRGAGGLSAWMLVPEPGSTTVRVRSIEGWSAAHGVRATWRRTDDGYRMDVVLDPVPEALDVVINEMPHGRQRRRGQLVMSGSAGEFVYLRGDRHEMERLIRLRVTDE